MMWKKETELQELCPEHGRCTECGWSEGKQPGARSCSSTLPMAAPFCYCAELSKRGKLWGSHGWRWLLSVEKDGYLWYCRLLLEAQLELGLQIPSRIPPWLEVVLETGRDLGESFFFSIATTTGRLLLSASLERLDLRAWQRCDRYRAASQGRSHSPFLPFLKIQDATYIDVAVWFPAPTSGSSELSVIPTPVYMYLHGDTHLCIQMM